MPEATEPAYIFVSNPRVASVAINRALEWQFQFNHMPARMIRAEIGDEAWARAFSFGMVRHPLDRLVSWFFYHRHYRGYFYNKEIYQGTFRDWVLAKCPHHWQFIPQVTYNWLSHPLNQWEFFYDGDTPIVSLIGRYEEKDVFLKTVCDRIGLNALALRHSNASQRLKDYLLCFQPDTLEIALRLFERDFALFGYERPNLRRL